MVLGRERACAEQGGGRTNAPHPGWSSAMCPSGPYGLSHPCLLNPARPEDPAPTTAALGPASMGPTTGGLLAPLPQSPAQRRDPTDGFCEHVKVSEAGPRCGLALSAI